MRVAQIIFGDSFGGAERMFVDLSVALHEAGVEVVPFCPPGTRTSSLLQSAGLDPRAIRARSSRDWLAAIRIRRAVRRAGCDIVHAYLSRATRLSAMARLDIPLVTSIHNYGTWKYYAGADYFMPISGYGAQYLREHGVAEWRVGIVRNFTRVPPRPMPKPKPGRPARILSYGRFVVEKGFQDLIDACRILHEWGLDFRLVLGGGGYHEGAIRAQIALAGLQNHVELAGWISDVMPYLDAADLFVLPSRQEPFGVVLLEAMARRVPIVTTRTVGPAEFLSAREAFFCDADNPYDMARMLAAALENPGSAATQAANAHQLYTRDYTPSAVVQDVITQYRHVVREFALEPRAT